MARLKLARGPLEGGGSVIQMQPMGLVRHMLLFRVH